MIIKVDYFSLAEKIIIKAKTSPEKIITLNGEEKNYDVDKFIFLIGDMISGWPKELVNDNILDGATYSIIIKNNEKKKTFIFKNKFPNDIWRLNGLIKEVSNA